MKDVTYHGEFHRLDLQSGDGAIADDNLLCHLNGLATQQAFPRGTIVFGQGLAPGALFLVCEGQLQLSTASPDGHSLFLRLAGPGNILGLSAVISNVPYGTTAQAVQPSVVKSLGRAEFLHLMNSRPEVAVRTAQELAKEYHALLHGTRRLAFRGSARGRLAQLLLDWTGNTDGVAEQRRITVAYTHEQIATMIATTRETVTRLINGFERQGIVRREGSLLEILKPKILKRLIFTTAAASGRQRSRAEAARKHGMRAERR